MKIGVKNYSDEEYFSALLDRADFLEVMAIPGKDYSYLGKLGKPITIHAQHERFGINVADKTKKEKNLESINFAIELANKFNSKVIIQHPGKIVNEHCSEEQAIDFLNSIKDKRVIIENVTHIKNKIGITFEGVGDIMKKTGKGLCFDVNHAIITALELGKDPYEYLMEFVKLKPAYYHIGGQEIHGGAEGTHLSFKDKESNIDLDKVLKIIPKDAQIALEVSTDIEKTKYDVDLTRKLDKER
jgi:sugar phosphate isomerase/epimerase